jgi:tight adherence protein B
VRRALAFVAALLWAAAPAGAQTGGAEVTSVEVDYPTVRLELLVPPAVAETAPTADAFAVVEAGSLVRAAVYAPAEVVTEVVLVVDTSGSMRGEPLEAAVDAAATFIDRLPDQTRIGLVTTGGRAEVALEPGTPASARIALNELAADGETALYDGVVSAAGLFDADPDTRALLVVLSDGADTVSAATVEETTAAVAGIELYAVHLTSPESDPEALAGLAGAGASLITTGADGLAAAYGGIADEVLGRYRIEYTTELAGPIEVLVRVEAAGTVDVAATTVELPQSAPPPIRPPADERVAVTTTTAVSVVRSATPAVPEIVAEPDGIGAPWSLPAGIAALGVGLLAVVLITLRSAPTARDKMADLTPAIAERSKGMLSGVAKGFESLAEGALERRGRGALERQLDRAGLQIRPSEYVVGGAALAIATVAAGSMLAGAVGGVLGGILGAAAPRLILRAMVRRRQARFSDQLEGTLQIIGGSLRAGYGLLQSIRTVAEEAESPTSDEFERVVTEHRLGRPLTDSLRAMADRLEDEDLRWVVEAIEIQQEVGGDLSEVLDTVAGTIRDRNQIRRQISALSAEGKMSAGILIALPFGIAGFIGMLAPDYLSELIGTGIGRMMAGMGIVLMGFGTVWIRKIIKVVF